jgi:uncharacterized SAM-binding protein YcdF (DUF218 family)
VLASPLWPALLAGALAIAFALAGRRRVAAWCAAFAFACVLAMTPLVGNALLGWLEAPYAGPVPACDGGDHVVVLAGGFERAARAPDDHDALSDASVRRLVRAITLARASPARRLVVTGGGAWRVPESAVLAALAVELGVPATTVERETDSHDTWQGAEALARSWGDRGARIWLVSSAWHLRRAMLAFETAGFDPCPVAADRRHRDVSDWGALLPQASGLRKTEVALHELAGIAWYRWRAAQLRSDPPATDAD